MVNNAEDNSILDIIRQKRYIIEVGVCVQLGISTDKLADM